MDFKVLGPPFRGHFLKSSMLHIHSNMGLTLNASRKLATSDFRPGQSCRDGELYRVLFFCIVLQRRIDRQTHGVSVI